MYVQWKRHAHTHTHKRSRELSPDFAQVQVDNYHCVRTASWLWTVNLEVPEISRTDKPPLKGGLNKRSTLFRPVALHKTNDRFFTCETRKREKTKQRPKTTTTAVPKLRSCDVLWQISLVTKKDHCLLNSGFSNKNHPGFVSLPVLLTNGTTKTGHPGLFTGRSLLI